MAREQKLYRLYNLADYLRSLITGDDINAETATYAKDRRGAMRTFEQGQHQGSFMLVWDGGNLAVTL